MNKSTAMSRRARTEARLDSGASWLCAEGQELETDYGTVRPAFLQADRHHAEEQWRQHYGIGRDHPAWQIEMDRRSEMSRRARDRQYWGSLDHQTAIANHISATSMIIDAYRIHRASEHNIMDEMVSRIKREHQYPGGYKMSVARVREARKLFHARMSVHKYEKQKALCELANRTGISYTPCQQSADRTAGTTKETLTRTDHIQGRLVLEGIREEHAEETIEEERNHRLNTAARRRLERNTTPFAHNGTTTLTPRRRPKITRDRIISYGMTTGCRGCKSALGNGMTTSHNDKCRERFDNINREEEGNRRDGPGTDGESTDPDMPSLMEPMEVEAHKEELESITSPTTTGPMTKLWEKKDNV